MSVRTTIDIPEQLHAELRERAASSGTSIRSLIINAIEQAYTTPRERASMSPARSFARRGSSVPAFQWTRILVTSFSLRGIEQLFRQLTEPFADKPASNWIGDCYLLAYAKSSDSTLVTCDSALGAFARKQGHPAVSPS